MKIPTRNLQLHHPPEKRNHKELLEMLSLLTKVSQVIIQKEIIKTDVLTSPPYKLKLQMEIKVVLEHKSNSNIILFLNRRKSVDNNY